MPSRSRTSTVHLKVGNPRAVAYGIPVLSYQDHGVEIALYEGDEFFPPDTIDASSIAELLANGFLISQ